MNETEYVIQRYDRQGALGWRDFVPAERMNAESAEKLFKDRTKHFPQHDWRLIKIEVLKSKKRSKQHADK